MENWTIEKQIQFIKEKFVNTNDDLNASDAYQAVLGTLMMAKERMDERTVSRFDVFINPEITRLLLDDGFIRGHYHDPYSGTKEQVIWNKRVGTDEYTQYHTVCVSKCEIGIEVEYDYGGGTTGGLWEFKEDDPASFHEAYDACVEAVKKKQLNPPRS